MPNGNTFDQIRKIIETNKDVSDQIMIKLSLAAMADMHESIEKLADQTDENFERINTRLLEIETELQKGAEERIMLRKNNIILWLREDPKRFWSVMTTLILLYVMAIAGWRAWILTALVNIFKNITGIDLGTGWIP